MKTIKVRNPQTVSKIIMNVDLHDDSTWKEWHSFIENELKENAHLFKSIFRDSSYTVSSVYLINGNLYRIGSISSYNDTFYIHEKIIEIGLKRNEFTRCEWVKRQKFTEDQLLQIYELFNDQ